MIDATYPPSNATFLCCGSQPNETLSVAVLQPGERATAPVVQCVAQDSARQATNAYGDVDILVTLKCEKASQAPSCTC